MSWIICYNRGGGGDFLQPNTSALHELDFWRRSWEEAMNSSPYVSKRIRNEKEVIEFWNKLAPNYRQQHTFGKGRERIDKIIGLLEKEQILMPDIDILDVGCGPGVYALSFAERARSVTALDSAKKMCMILEEKLKKAALANITVLVRRWEEMDLEKEGMVCAYDLVFASLTPAVCDYETLLKLNQASRRFCCLISWAGKAFDQAREELWELLFGEKESGRGYDIIYPFNILYSLGYCPAIRYFDSVWEQEETIEQAVESLCRYFWLYVSITPAVKNIITKYVKERAINGLFSQKTIARLGVMTWRVDQAKLSF